MNVNETEAKYDAPGGVTLPRLERLPQVASTCEREKVMLEAAYYDTGDLRLLCAGIMLRRRLGGSDAGWHLQLPLSGETRREIRLPPGRASAPVPAELAGLVLAHARAEPLRPVARISTSRQLLVLLDQAGESLAEIAADDVCAQTMGNTTTLSQWHEVEVELTGGTRQLLKAADELLRKQGLHPASHAAKLERALGQRPAVPGSRQPLPASAPTGQVVLSYLRTQAEILKSLDPLVRSDHADSVHRMRVATRRLRSTLRTFGSIIRCADAEQAASELKWLSTVLGGTRDAEVLASHLLDGLGHLPPELVIGPVQSRVQGHFAPVRAGHRATLLAALDSRRYFSLLDTLDRVLADPPLTPLAGQPAEDVLPAMTRRAGRRVSQRMRQAARAAPGQPQDEALHQARKAAKRARYAGEVMALATGKQARRFVRQMKEVQSVLGEHHDTVLARQKERELGISAHLAGENAFSYGILHGFDTCEAQRLVPIAQRTSRRAAR